MRTKTITKTAIVAIAVLAMGLVACSGKKETASKVGTIDTNGTFTASTGAYEITLPKGWKVSPDSEESVVALQSENGKDVIEIIYLSGEDAKGNLKQFPETAAEYNETELKMSPAKEITKYNILRDDDAKTEIFQIYCKFEKSDTTPYTFTAMSGVQDQDGGVYCAANALIQSDGKEDEITKTIDSFQILKLK